MQILNPGQALVVRSVNLSTDKVITVPEKQTQKFYGAKKGKR